MYYLLNIYKILKIQNQKLVRVKVVEDFQEVVVEDVVEGLDKEEILEVVLEVGILEEAEVIIEEEDNKYIHEKFLNKK